MVSFVCVDGIVFSTCGTNHLPEANYLNHLLKPHVHICAARSGRCRWQGITGDSVCLASGSEISLN